jgi:hypothetical protein
MKYNSRLLLLLALLLSGCGLTIEGVHYGWPVESVLTVGPDNRVADGHNGVSFSVAEIAQEEFQDSSALQSKQVRLLRSDEGYYFLTARGFKNVYVFSPGPAKLHVKSRLAVAPNGLLDPALNQRTPYVELVDGTSVKKLTSNDILEGGKK